MEIRVQRRPPYRLTRTSTTPASAANIFRGPLLYALPRNFTRDHSAPYDDGPGLLPEGQAHGENQYLLGEGDWTYALHISNDKSLKNDLQFFSKTMPALPRGQGPFAESLVPVRITAKGYRLNS